MEMLHQSQRAYGNGMVNMADVPSHMAYGMGGKAVPMTPDGIFEQQNHQKGWTQGFNARPQQQPHNGQNMKNAPASMAGKKSRRLRPNHPFNSRNVRLNAKICQVADKGNIWELLELARTHSLEMNYVNLSTFLHRVARLSKQTNMVQAVSGYPLLALICTKVESELAVQEAALSQQCMLAENQDSLPRCWSTIAWSYATLQFHDQAVFMRLAKLSEACITAFKPLELGNLLWAFAKVHEPAQGLFDAATRHIPTQLSKFTPVSLSAVTWAYATLQPKPPVALLKSISQAFVEQIQNAQSQEIANMCWALATANVVKPHVFEKLGAAALGKLLSFNVQEIANTVWAFSRAGLVHMQLFEALRDLLKQGSSLVLAFHGQALANTMWALSKQYKMSGHALFPSIAAILLPACCRALQYFKSQELSCVLWSAAILGFRTGDNHIADQLFDAAADMDGVRLSNLSVQGLTNILYAFTEHVNGSPLYVNFLGQMTRTMVDRLKEFNAKSLLYVLESTQSLLSKNLPVPNLQMLTLMIIMGLLKHSQELTPHSMELIVAATSYFDHDVRSMLANLLASRGQDQLQTAQADAASQQAEVDMQRLVHQRVLTESLGSSASLQQKNSPQRAPVRRQPQPQATYGRSPGPLPPAPGMEFLQPDFANDYSREPFQVAPPLVASQPGLRTAMSQGTLPASAMGLVPSMDSTPIDLGHAMPRGPLQTVPPVISAKPDAGNPLVPMWVQGSSSLASTRNPLSRHHQAEGDESSPRMDIDPTQAILEAMQAHRRASAATATQPAEGYEARPDMDYFAYAGGNEFVAQEDHAAGEFEHPLQQMAGREVGSSDAFKSMNNADAVSEGHLRLEENYGNTPVQKDLGEAEEAETEERQAWRMEAAEGVSSSEIDQPRMAHREDCADPFDDALAGEAMTLQALSRRNFEDVLSERKDGGANSETTGSWSQRKLGMRPSPLQLTRVQPPANSNSKIDKFIGTLGPPRSLEREDGDDSPRSIGERSSNRPSWADEDINDCDVSPILGLAWGAEADRPNIERIED